MLLRFIKKINGAIRSYIDMYFRKKYLKQDKNEYTCKKTEKGLEDRDCML